MKHSKYLKNILFNFDKKLNKNYKLLDEEEIEKFDKEYNRKKNIKNVNKKIKKKLEYDKDNIKKKKKLKKLKDNNKNNIEKDKKDNIEKDKKDNIKKDKKDNIKKDKKDNIKEDKKDNSEKDKKDNIEKDKIDNIEKDKIDNIEKDKIDNNDNFFSDKIITNKEKENLDITFEDLNICNEILESIYEIGWKKPTLIQMKTIPIAMKKNDLIALSETGSGKTACFIIPILEELRIKKQSFFALIICPTRELCIQISEHFNILGSNLFVNICTLYGGINITSQSLELAKKPNIIVSTPGRILDHLNNTKGFNLNNLKYLVFDEADKLLSSDFENSINKLLLVLPKNRYTYLFSATMTNNVIKLKKACLKNPVKIETSNKYSTVNTLIENYIFIPYKYKYTYLTTLCFHFYKTNIIIFTNTCSSAEKLNYVCRNLNLKSLCMHGKLTQPQRLSNLNKFKANKYNILICTQLGSRGLDLNDIKIVINFDLCSCKEYIHRVGRTARGGKFGKSITFVTQYDVENFLYIEKQLNKKIDKFTEIDELDVLVNHEKTNEALRLADISMKENKDIYRNKKYKKK